MDLSESLKTKIDNMTITQLLHKYRFGKIGDPIFQGDSGVYLSEKLFTARAADPEAWVRASKEIGWE